MTDTDALLETIAKQQLDIETLKTRNSDSLDFHEVSVWSLRSALLCVFEAGRSEGKTKKRFVETGKAGTCYQATIEANYNDLVEIWGQPSKGDNYKTEAEWVIRLPNEKVATIYNYKNSRAYADQYPEITSVHEWNIGGHSAEVVDKLLGMMIGRAKLVYRAERASHKG
ncbi:MAG: hypothetical protein PHS57_00900 [Alphaproteobacteria bacterium]|nr:hypothetical protein [Alphaproteobacteria bacterium]